MKVLILYNPKSKGASKTNAFALARTLKKNNVDVSVMKTTHPHHGEEIAVEYSKKGKEMLLISSSGDGGYHDIVNGVLSVSSSPLVVGVLPSGNANDHAVAVGSGSLADSIIQHSFTKIDTIQVSATVGGKKLVRYAHSYAGMGLTAIAAQRLTEERPDAFSEKWIALHALFSFRYIKVIENGKVKRYSSILFGNIDRMSKVISLSTGASLTDGKFEMSSVSFGSKFRLVITLLSAMTLGLKDAQSRESYVCKTVRPVPIQLDGEVYSADAGSTIDVRSMKQNLRCVL